MANYKTVELIIIEYLLSDVYRSYMVSSNPEYRWCVVFVVYMYIILYIKIHHKIKVHNVIFLF
jgi:hypothetical protein